jgi:hypothetical protein
MRTGSAICLGLTAASLATIVGVPTALSVRCHKQPEGTKATAKDSRNVFKGQIPCPYVLQENGDVIGGILHRKQRGHIFPNGTALDQDGLFLGEARENGALYRAFPGVDNIDAYIDAERGKNASQDALLGIRAKGLVDAKGDVYKDITNCDKWGNNCVTSPEKQAHLSKKSPKATEREKNALGLFFLA